MGQGNGSCTSDRTGDCHFSADSQKKLAQIFHEASAGQRYGSSEKVQEVLCRVLHAEISSRLCVLMRAPRDSGSGGISFEEFVGVASRLLKGSAHELSSMLLCVLVDQAVPVLRSHVKQYIGRMMCSYLRVIASHRHQNQIQQDDVDLNSTVEYLMSDLDVGTHPENAQGEVGVVQASSLEKWLMCSPLFAAVQLCVLRATFGLDIPDNYVHILPDLSHSQDHAVLLRPPHLMLVNWNLPYSLRHKWRLLFDNRLHGNSYSLLVKNIVGRGASVVVVQDHRGHVFGGFCPVDFQCTANFYGTDQTFLFSVRPTVNIHTATGYNDNYVYCNIGQRTLPNGLGFGGKFEFFGLFLCADFGSGFTAPSCSTFNCRLLSGDKRFCIDTVQVWAVGDQDHQQSGDQGAPSVLDADAESRAMLQLIQGRMHSDGVRERSSSLHSPDDKTLPPL